MFMGRLPYDLVGLLVFSLRLLPHLLQVHIRFRELGLDLFQGTWIVILSMK
jgi:hypothetical protein